MLRKPSTVLLSFLLLLTTLTPALAQRPIPEPRPVPVVDINSAPLQEIEAAVMDEAIARRIFDNRPYANKRQLLTRRLVTLEEYERIQSRIVARQPRDPE